MIDCKYILHTDEFFGQTHKLKNTKILIYWSVTLFSYMMADSVIVIVEGVWANLGITKKVTIGKKSTIFFLYPWKLVKITSSWGNHFDQVSWG